MRLRNSNKKYFIIASIILGLSLGVFFFNKQKNIDEIDKILTSEYYSYLPIKAKNYVREVYEATGSLILTEKNKQDNKPYLNPLYVDYLEMSMEEQEEESIVPMATVVDYFSPTDVDSASLPSRYDMRNLNGKNYISPVRNQGNLGICWAFSTAEVLETFAMKSSNTSYSNTSQLFSERQIDYATSIDGIKDYNNEYVSFLANRSLGDGGNFYIATVAMAGGVSSVPYNTFKSFSDVDFNKEELSTVLNYGKSKYEVDETINMGMLSLRESTSALTQSEQILRTNYINEVKSHIQEYGSAYVSTYVNNDCAYNDSGLNNVVIDVYKCTLNNGHALQIIGWDDNLEYKYCADNNKHKTYSSSCSNPVIGKGVWILKNSWGSSNTPYPYLTYDSLYSQISFIKSVTPVSEKKWENSYLLGNGNSISTVSHKMSNTRIKGIEKLERVKFTTNSEYGTYRIKIVDTTGNTRTYSKTVSNWGMITIEITDNVLVDENSTITISSSSEFYDEIQLFTSNTNSIPSIDLSAYDSITISDYRLRFYGETKNVPANTTLSFKLYQGNVDVSNNISVSNNIVAYNNVNALINFNSLSNGEYTLKVYYGSNLLTTIHFEYERMSGSGTSADPYVINNATHLRQIESDLDGYYILGSDIDLSLDTSPGGKYYYSLDGSSEGYGWKPISGFMGTLDGKGHIIKGLNQNTYSESNPYLSKLNAQGLFASVKGDLTIKNLILEDFNIKCHEDCGFLFNKFFQNSNSNNNVTLENIAIKNSILTNSSTSSSSSIGGLFGTMNASTTSNVNINSIYNDSTIVSTGNAGYLLGTISGAKIVNVTNIMAVGDFVGKSYNSGGISYSISAGNISIKNILSTIDYANIGGIISSRISLTNISGVNSLFTINGINALNINGKNLVYSNTASNSTSTYNVNLFEKGVSSNNFTNSTKYSLWSNFSTNWELKTIDGIKRYPVLKFLDFDYLDIDDIQVELDDKNITIFDFINLDSLASKRLSVLIDDESIVTINSNGLIVPKKLGNTIIHVESYYDGYKKDIPITVVGNYYYLKYNANGGIGSMVDGTYKVGLSIILSENSFTKEGYVFKGWNTRADGSGLSYGNQQRVSLPAKSGETINLYAQWEPIKYTVRFNANGGVGLMDDQEMSYSSTYSLSKNLFIKNDCYFKGWNTKVDGSGTSYKDEEAVLNMTKENNALITLYAQWESNYNFEVTSYSLNNKKNYIDLIPYNTGVNKFKNNIKTNYEIVLSLNGYNNIATGSKTMLYKNGSLYLTYINIVRGDINSDSKISALDYVMVKNHIMGTSYISNDVNKTAADVNNDGKISALDYVKIKNIIMGG